MSASLGSSAVTMIDDRHSPPISRRFPSLAAPAFVFLRHAKVVADSTEQSATDNGGTPREPRVMKSRVGAEIGALKSKHSPSLPPDPHQVPRGPCSISCVNVSFIRSQRVLQSPIATSRVAVSFSVTGLPLSLNGSTSPTPSAAASPGSAGAAVEIESQSDAVSVASLGSPSSKPLR